MHKGFNKNDAYSIPTYMFEKKRARTNEHNLFVEAFKACKRLTDVNEENMPKFMLTQ